MNEDWRYSDDRLVLRSQCLSLLLHTYGSVKIDEASYSTQDIYECVDTWISQGGQFTDDIIKYFNSYFNHAKKTKEDDDD